MGEYLSPGVYVEEVDAGPKPIEGVSTSTAGAIGVTERGPTGGTPRLGRPRLVTSFSEFVRVFGGYLPDPPAQVLNAWANDPAEGGRWWQFALSVRGFFDNGGQRLFVKRVFSAAATAAEIVSGANPGLGTGLSATIIHDAPATAATLRVSHLFGVDVGTAVTLLINGQARGPFNVTAFQGTGTVTLDNPVGVDVEAGRDSMRIIDRAAAPAPGPGVGTLRVIASALGQWGGTEDPNVPDNIQQGNGLSVSVGPVAGATLRILPSPTFGGAVVETELAAVPNGGQAVIAVNSVAGFNVGDRVVVVGRTFGINAIAAPNITLDANVPGPANAPNANWPVGTSVRRLRPANDAQATTLAAQADNADVQLSVADSRGFAVGDVLTINGAPFTVTATNNSAPGTLDINPPVPTPAGGNAGDPNPNWPAALRVARQADPIVSMANAVQAYRGALIELDNGRQKEVFTVVSVTGDRVELSATPAETYHENDRARVVEAELLVRYYRRHRLEAEESFSNLRLVDDGTINYIVTRVNEQSELVRLEVVGDFAPGDLTEFPSLPPPAAGTVNALPSPWWRLTGGADNNDQLTPDDFAGVDNGSGRRTGVLALEDIDEVSICLAPGMWSATVHNALVQHCELLKDRFAVLDPQDRRSIDQIRQVREGYDTKYAALYYPWIVVRDPLAGRNVDLAPSGHVAGIYARVDVERGVHKAPANEVVRSIIRIADDVTKREQDLLNPRNINVLRFFPNRGNRVWGARALTSDSAWKYINVRRLFIMIEESIDEGTQWVVFEPNDEGTWSRVVQSVTNFLLTQWRNGALQGTTAEEAFFVKCDRTTMTQDDIDNGRLICLIGIAPVKPAEFVIFRISQKTLEAQQS